jgi:hypothetical protein
VSIVTPSDTSGNISLSLERGETPLSRDVTFEFVKRGETSSSWNVIFEFVEGVVKRREFACPPGRMSSSADDFEGTLPAMLPRSSADIMEESEGGMATTGSIVVAIIATVIIATANIVATTSIGNEVVVMRRQPEILLNGLEHVDIAQISWFFSRPFRVVGRYMVTSCGTNSCFFV